MTKADNIDLTNHTSITCADQIKKIIAPISSSFGIKHFRYLKLYTNGSRVLLSNYQQCTHFAYEQGWYKEMWFDGEFPENLIEGWHIWDVKRAIYEGGTISAFEEKIHQTLGLFSGMTYVSEGMGFYEIYTFDSDNPQIYTINIKLLMRFILYFKQQAQKLLKNSENEKINVKIKSSLPDKFHGHSNTNKVTTFIENTRINRYYLGGKYHGCYLTAKEAQCVYWLLHGKSIEEIAIIQNNSVRTIECHFENIRSKLNCYKQTQLVRVILENWIHNDIELLN